MIFVLICIDFNNEAFFKIPNIIIVPKSLKIYFNPLLKALLQKAVLYIIKTFCSSWNSIFRTQNFLLTRIASTGALLQLLNRAFSFATRPFNLATSAFSPLTCGFELVSWRFELVVRGFELVTRNSQVVSRNSCFTFPHFNISFKRLKDRYPWTFFGFLYSKLWRNCSRSGLSKGFFWKASQSLHENTWVDEFL